MCSVPVQKEQNETKRGKFGEGYKLALLVLVRLHHTVAIHTSNEVWSPALEHDDTFNTTVMNIYTQEVEPSDGVLFIIQDVLPEHYAAIQANLRPDPNEPETILDEPEQAGRIYVGGLYVSSVPRFKCGYSFRPGTVKLDRDRGMVDGFDLAWATSKLWTAAGHSERLSALLESEAPDVEYVESHVSEDSQFANHHYNYYVARHGYAIPVSTQDEIQRATSAGLKWTLVPEKVKSMLNLVKKFFIPNSSPLIQRLKDFRDRNQYYLTGQGRRELDEIIHSLEPEE